MSKIIHVHLTEECMHSAQELADVLTMLHSQKSYEDYY